MPKVYAKHSYKYTPISTSIKGQWTNYFKPYKQVFTKHNFVWKCLPVSLKNNWTQRTKFVNQIALEARFVCKENKKTKYLKFCSNVYLGKIVPFQFECVKVKCSNNLLKYPRATITFISLIRNLVIWINKFVMNDLQ